MAYKAAADSLNDMTSGALDYAVHNPVLALSQHREGKWRILGVGSNERLQSIPDLPTMTEQGIPMNIIGWWTATVPAGTPRPAIDLINKQVGQILGTDETKKFLNNFGGDTFLNTPETAQALMLKEIDNWRDYVKLARIVPQG